MSYTKLTDFAAKDALLSGNPSKLLRGTEIGAEFDAIESAMAAAEAVNITAPIITASTSKTTPVDADVLPILDSAAANILKKVTWANVKATLKTYFDTLYAAVGSFAASGANADITSLTALTAGGLPNNSVLTADIADGQVTGAKIAASTITPDKLAQPLTLMTAQSATGTSVDFSSIPSWAKRITLSFYGVSTNGSSNFLFQIGSGSPQTTGYISHSIRASSGGNASASGTNGFAVNGPANAVDFLSGIAVFTLVSGNAWVFSATATNDSGTFTLNSSGRVTLSGALSVVRFTSVTPDTFDAGSVNVLYE